MGESPFFELSTSLNNSVENKPKVLGEDVDGYVQYLADNQCDLLGISSGYQRYDQAIGGGFRRKAVDLIGARPKTGKSMFADNVGFHIAANLDIPVLMLDTEMSKEDHITRLLAKFSSISINDIIKPMNDVIKPMNDAIKPINDVIKPMNDVIKPVKSNLVKTVNNKL